MGVLIYNNIDGKEKVKSIVLKFLEKNEIPYIIIENADFESIHIDLNFEDEAFKSDFYYAPLMIETSDKDICKVYPYEIMHIAIEDRESVLYLIDKRVVRTSYHISHWEDVLSSRCFKRPHHSYIVNLNYVTEVTGDFVYLKYRNNQYTVYTSQRKVRKFKKAFLNFGIQTDVNK
jgi:DNA-binding LytR/AlgR family response regulator